MVGAERGRRYQVEIARDPDITEAVTVYVDDLDAAGTEVSQFEGLPLDHALAAIEALQCTT